MRSPNTAMQPIASILSFSGVAGAVRVDVVDVVRREAGIVDRVADRGDDRRRRPGSSGCGGSRRPSRRSRARSRGSSAPRARAASAFSSTSAAAPSPMTKPSRFFEKGFEAASGGSFWVDSAESSENRISDSGCTEPSVPMHSAASVSPRRIASTPELDRGRAGRAGGRERDRRALGAEPIGDPVGDGAEDEQIVPGLEAARSRPRSRRSA